MCAMLHGCRPVSASNVIQRMVNTNFLSYVRQSFLFTWTYLLVTQDMAAYFPRIRDVYQIRLVVMVHNVTP